MVQRKQSLPKYNNCTLRVQIRKSKNHYLAVILKTQLITNALIMKLLPTPRAHTKHTISIHGEMSKNSLSQDKFWAKTLKIQKFFIMDFIKL